MLTETLLRDFFETPNYSNRSTTFVPSKFAIDVDDDIAHIALSVIGHNPENISIDCFEDKIEIKAKTGDITTLEKSSAINQLISNIDETIRIGKSFDGRTANAEIKNGILILTVERKEESKPKKLTPKVG